MTSGTITDDKQSTQSTSCGNALVGYKYVKTWSGSDDTTPKPKLPRSPPTAYYAYKRNKKGELIRVVRHHAGKPLRPPKRARGRGEHPYTMSLTEVRYPLIHWSLDNGVTFPYTGTVQSCFGGVAFDGTWTSNDDLKLIQKLREKMSGANFDMSVFLGTSHESLKLIADSAIRIASMYENLRKGNLSKAAQDLTGFVPKRKRGVGQGKQRHIVPNSAQAMADALLELRYGWLPLLQDVKDAAEFLAHQLSAPAVVSYKVNRKITLKPRGASPSNITPMNAYGYESGSIIARLSEEPSLVVLLGLTNPATLVWEATPWSFVADWFIPIGSYLSARAFAGGLKGTFITTRKRETFCRGAKSTPGSSTPMSGPSEQYLSHGITLNRSISSSLAVPLPTVKSFSEAASWGHCENALALLTGVASRIERKFGRSVTY